MDPKLQLQEEHNLPNISIATVSAEVVKPPNWGLSTNANISTKISINSEEGEVNKIISINNSNILPTSHFQPDSPKSHHQESHPFSNCVVQHLVYERQVVHVAHPKDLSIPTPQTVVPITSVVLPTPVLENLDDSIEEVRMVKRPSRPFNIANFSNENWRPT